MKEPTVKQRRTVLIALAVMAIMTIVPPWVYTVWDQSESFNVPAGYRILVFAPRDRQENGEIDDSLSPRINVERLLFQYIAVLLIAAFALVKQRKPSTEIRHNDQIKVDDPKETDPSNPYGLTDEEREYGPEMIALAEKISSAIVAREIRRYARDA